MSHKFMFTCHGDGSIIFAKDNKIIHYMSYEETKDETINTPRRGVISLREYAEDCRKSSGYYDRHPEDRPMT